MDSSFIARPVRLFGIGLAAIVFGCNSAPPTHANSVPSSGQVDASIASADAADTSAAGAGGAASTSAASGGAAGHLDVVAPDADAGAGDMNDPSAGVGGAGDPSNGGQRAAAAITVSATDPGDGGGDGAIAVSATDPSDGGSDGAIAMSETDPSDGGAPVCESGELRCTEGCTKTCQPNGTWGPAIACPGGHQTCSISTGKSKCVCKVDGVCGLKVTGPVCFSETSVTTCVKDEYGCVFHTAASECAHACEGVPGVALCAEGPCTTVGATRCESSFALETCSATGTGGTAFVAENCAADTVCGRNAPASCLDPNWADWPMPNGLLDAANGAPNPQRFTDNGDGSVTDTVTGLEWSWVTFYAQTLADAWDVCKGMHLLDTGDWRVPSLIELISIADFGEPSNINEKAFPPPHDVQRWTTTLRGDGSDEHFSFNFALGQVSFIDDQSQDALHPHAINCVR